MEAGGRSSRATRTSVPRSSAGRALVRSSAKVIVEVHGDPKTLTRLYRVCFP